MSSASLRFPTSETFPVPLFDRSPEAPQCRLGPNDSPIHRGDREETGDEEARPDEVGSGYAIPTVDPTAFGGTSSISHPTTEHLDVEDELHDTEGFEVMTPDDGRLGLTNVGNKPPDDWAADTGETRTPESSEP